MVYSVKSYGISIVDGQFHKLPGIIKNKNIHSLEELNKFIEDTYAREDVLSMTKTKDNPPSKVCFLLKNKDFTTSLVLEKVE